MGRRPGGANLRRGKQRRLLRSVGGQLALRCSGNGRYCASKSATRLPHRGERLSTGGPREDVRMVLLELLFPPVGWGCRCHAAQPTSRVACLPPIDRAEVPEARLFRFIHRPRKFLATIPPEDRRSWMQIMTQSRRGRASSWEPRMKTSFSRSHSATCQCVESFV